MEITLTHYSTVVTGLLHLIVSACSYMYVWRSLFGVRVTLHVIKTYQMGVVGSVCRNARSSHCKAFLLAGMLPWGGKQQSKQNGERQRSGICFDQPVTQSGSHEDL